MAERGRGGDGGVPDSKILGSALKTRYCSSASTLLGDKVKKYGTKGGPCSEPVPPFLTSAHICNAHALAHLSSRPLVI